MVLGVAVELDFSQPWHRSGPVFGNGEAFYAKQGKVITLPDRRGDQPTVDFLQWHIETMFKAS